MGGRSLIGFFFGPGFWREPGDFVGEARGFGKFFLGGIGGFWGAKDLLFGPAFSDSFLKPFLEAHRGVLELQEKGLREFFFWKAPHFEFWWKGFFFGGSREKKKRAPIFRLSGAKKGFLGKPSFKREKCFEMRFLWRIFKTDS